VKVEQVGTLEQVLVGPRPPTTAPPTCSGGLRRAMAMTGYSTLKEFQRVEVMARPGRPQPAAWACVVTGRRAHVGRPVAIHTAPDRVDGKEHRRRPAGQQAVAGAGSAMATASWNGTVIAESDDTVVVEGNHYFPRASLREGVLVESAKTSVCAWKGTASYASVVVDGQTNADAAWFYPEPKPEAEQIRDHVAFWKGVEVSA
jgi:uncharacterized protein (DUF427 family)